MGLFEKIIEKFFPSLPEEELAGISLDMSACWEVAKGKKNCRVCFRELPKLLPPGSTLCIQGTSIADDVKSYLDAHRVKEITKVQIGTLWPRSAVYHVPCDKQTLSGLIELSKKHAEPEMFDHISVYKDREVLFESYDAFDQRIYISKKVPEDKVSTFCAAVKCVYKEGSVPDWHGKNS